MALLLALLAQLVGTEDGLQVIQRVGKIVVDHQIRLSVAASTFYTTSNPTMLAFRISKSQQQQYHNVKTSNPNRSKSASLTNRSFLVVVYIKGDAPTSKYQQKKPILLIILNYKQQSMGTILE